jgi:hypothetical protein
VTRGVLATGILLLLLGLGVFVWKTLVLDLPLAPGDAEGLWRVELVLSARGVGRRGSVRVPLPSSGPGQAVFDERTVSDRLVFTIRTEDGQRLGVWSGRFEGVHELVHGFRVQLDEYNVELAAGGSEPPPPELVRRYATSSPELPSENPEVAAQLERLTLPRPEDRLARLRSLFAFVADEVATVDTAADDAILALTSREGSPVGKTRLLVTLLRAVGMPSRIVLGLQLRPELPPVETVWAEAWVDGGWVPLSPVEGLFGRRPADRVALRVGSDEALQKTGIDAVGRRYFALRERLRPEELAALMVPPSPWLAPLSLYRLPVATQTALRGLLLLPLGALAVAFFRNVVGVPTFGTFMPILIAFSLRAYPLGAGLLLVGAVLTIGILGRLVLDRLRLLLVPRLAVLLCIVVLGVTAAALLGRSAETRELFAGVLFPLVILTMLIERFSVTVSEEGWRSAFARGATSLLVAVAVHPVFRSPTAEQLMFGFPELVVATMGLLILIGGYTGFRVVDLIRFRAFARLGAGTPS